MFAMHEGIFIAISSEQRNKNTFSRSHVLTREEKDISIKLKLQEKEKN